MFTKNVRKSGIKSAIAYSRDKSIKTNILRYETRCRVEKFTQSLALDKIMLCYVWLQFSTTLPNFPSPNQYKTLTMLENPQPQRRLQDPCQWLVHKQRPEWSYPSAVACSWEPSRQSARSQMRWPKKNLLITPFFSLLVYNLH